MIFTAPGCFVSAPVVENVVGAAAAGAAAPAVENVEAAAVAGGSEEGDSDLGDGGHSCGDASSRTNRKRKPSGGGIILGRKLESRSDHRGMRSVTTTIGDRKRKSAHGPI